VKVFISWSGQLSGEIGKEFRDWLPSVIQAVEPYLSPADIEKGKLWYTDIANELEGTDFGLFLMTENNLSSPWIMFEAGALSKQVGISRICPILFNIENTDLQGPLTQFQTTKFNRDEIRMLVGSINSACERRLDDLVLDKVYNKWWPELDTPVTLLLEKPIVTKDKAARTERELAEETLALVRSISRDVQAKPRYSRERTISPMEFKSLWDEMARLKEDLEHNELNAARDHLNALERQITYITSVDRDFLPLRDVVESDPKILRDKVLEINKWLKQAATSDMDKNP